MNRRIMMASVLTVFALAGCHSASTTAGGTTNTGAATTGTATTGGAAPGGGGACSYLTTADVSQFFTGKLDSGAAGTDGNGSGSKDCLYKITGTSSDGLQISTNVDYNFWKGQFTEATPVSGVGDEALSVNNGLALLAKKGSATCLAMVTISDPSQLSTPMSNGAIPEADRPAFATKLGSLCAKALG